MTTDALIILAGALVAVLPSLGFPVSWDNVFYVVLGVFIVALGIAVRRKKPAIKQEVKQTLFTESTPAVDHHEETLVQ